MSYPLRFVSPGILRSRSSKSHSRRISIREEKNLVRKLSESRICSGELPRPHQNAPGAIQLAAEMDLRNLLQTFSRWPALPAESEVDSNSIRRELRQSGHDIFR